MGTLLLGLWYLASKRVRSNEDVRRVREGAQKHEDQTLIEDEIVRAGPDAVQHLGISPERGAPRIGPR